MGACLIARSTAASSTWRPGAQRGCRRPAPSRSCLGALLATAKEARVQGGDLRLSNVTPHVLKILEMSGFTSIMKLYDDVESAVDSYAV